MISLPEDHYKILKLRLFFIVLNISYWNRKYAGNVGGKIVSYLNHDSFNFSGHGYRKRYLYFSKQRKNAFTNVTAKR